MANTKNVWFICEACNNNSKKVNMLDILRKQNNQYNDLNNTANNIQLTRLIMDVEVLVSNLTNMDKSISCLSAKVDCLSKTDAKEGCL